MSKQKQLPLCDMSKWYRYYIVPLYQKGMPPEKMYTSASDKIPSFKTGMAWVYKKDVRGDDYSFYGSMRFGKFYPEQ